MNQSAAPFSFDLARYRMIFELAGVSIIICSEEGIAVECNQEALKLFACTREQMIGASPITFSPKFQPNGRSSLEMAGEVFAEAKSIGMIRFEWENIRADGLPLTVDATVRFDCNEEKNIFIIISHDITERRRLEAAQAEALSLLQKVASRVPGVVYQYRLRPDGRSCFPFASDAIREIFRVSPVDVCEDASSVFAIIHPDDHGEVIASIQKSAQDLTPWQQEYRVKFDDGTVRWQFGNALPEREADGSTLWHGFINDMTERKDLEIKVQQRTQELQIALQVKSAFLSNMSHEIRTPMNAILGITQLILLTDLTPKQRNYQDKINVSAQGLLGILNDILDFSKIEAGKLELEYAEFRLESVIQYLKDVSVPLLAGKPIALFFELALDLPTALIGDSLRLGQVLLNLLSNAIKFTKTGRVTVSVSLQSVDATKACLHFCVTDTGIGISGEQQNNVFDAFSQADNSTTRLYGGTGLGLAISKDLVAAMGGTIGIESKVGVGSSFYFTATFGVQSLSKAKELPAQFIRSDNYPALRNAYVLLVEDNLINQELMLEMLANKGIHVDLANNGIEAIEMIAKNDYSLVLMDCQMPVMDGFEATRHLRTDPRFATLPIIAMTGNVMKEDIERCLASGMNTHIGKPVDWDLFFQTLEHWIKPQITHNNEELAVDENVFPMLTGVDLAAVRKLVSNNVAIYRKILTLFCANHKDDIALIRAAQHAGDYDAAVQITHKLNGSANSIAQTPLSGLTAELQQAFKQHNDPVLNLLLEKTETVLLGLIAEINQVLPTVAESASSGRMYPYLEATT